MQDQKIIRITINMASILTMGFLMFACKANSTKSDHNIIIDELQSNKTSAEENLRNESSIFTKSSMQACLVTAALVGGTTYAITKSKKKSLTLAVGACAIGVGANYYVQQRRKEYVNNEQRLHQMIADVREDNERLSRIIVAAEEVVMEDKKLINEIDRAYQKKQISMEEAKKQMLSVEENQGYLEQTLENLKKREEQWRKVAWNERSEQSKTGMAEMDEEITKLEKQIAVFESDLEILVNRRSISPIG